MKEYIHSDLLSLSIEQTAEGRLPKGLIEEITEATKIGINLTEAISTEQIFTIEDKIKSDDGYWPRDLVLKFSEKKLYSKWLPGIVGGGGEHPLALYGLNTILGSKCLGISNLIGAHYIGLGLVSMTGSFKVLKKITNDIKNAEKNNEHCVVAISITEPGAGSDMEEAELIKKARVNTKAVKVAGGYRINGQKIFISNASFAKWFVGSAFTDLACPEKSLVIFAVRSDAPGIELGRKERKLGQLASPTSVLFYDNVFIPDEDICFSPDQFFDQAEVETFAKYILNDLISYSRAGVGALATGAQKRILEIVLEHQKANLDKQYVQARVSRILQNFTVSKMVSWNGHMECYSRGAFKDMHRPMVYQLLKSMPDFFYSFILKSLSKKSIRKKRKEMSSSAAEKYVYGMGSLVKSFCSDKAMESVQIALEIIGHDGSRSALELEKFSRDLKLLQIYEGANELNELMIYKSFVGPKDADHLIFKE